ncbi:MAG: hypothetical protein AB2598_15115 [Candidatus Thiodiazotropha sp.]
MDGERYRVHQILLKCRHKAQNLPLPTSYLQETSMIPINYQVTGEEEYSFHIEIDSIGNYTVHTGTYTTQKPRAGKLSTEQEAELQEAAASLGDITDHPQPGGGQAFQAKLVVGEGEKQVVYTFWEGALEEDEGLAALVRRLEVI